MTGSETDLKEISAAPLREEEIRRLRRLLLEDDRAKYFWRTIRIWVGWGAAVVGFIYAGWDTIIKFGQAIVRAAFGAGH